jgi:hypothetical protein
MRQLRFLAFAVISFVAALLGALLSPSTWLHKALAVALCGVLSANPALCTNNAIAVHSQEASAINPVKVETTQFSDLLVQRSRDFDDDTPKSPPRPNPNNPKPPSFPNDPGSNFPVRSPDFDDSFKSNIATDILEFQELKPGVQRFFDTKKCEQVATYKSKSDKVFIESATITIPIDGISCVNGKLEILADYILDGDTVTLTSKKSNSLIKIQGLRGENWEISYIDGAGSRTTQSFKFGSLKNTDPQNAIATSYTQTKILPKEQYKSILTNRVNLVASSDSDRCKKEREYCKKLKRAHDNIKPMADAISNPLLGWLSTLVGAGAGVGITAAVGSVGAELAALAASVLSTVWSLMIFQDANYCFYYYGETGGYHTDMLISYGKFVKGITEQQARKKIEEASEKFKKRSEERCKDQEIGKCGQQQVSGGQKGDIRTIQLTASRGRITIKWDMKPVPDRLQIFYEGRSLLDTGFVSGTGERTIEFEGASKQVEVIVTGNQSVSTTEWDYTLSCPFELGKLETGAKNC